MGEVAILAVLVTVFFLGFGSGFGLRSLMSRRRRYEARRAAGLV